MVWIVVSSGFVVVFSDSVVILCVLFHGKMSGFGLDGSCCSFLVSTCSCRRQRYSI